MYELHVYQQCLWKFHRPHKRTGNGYGHRVVPEVVHEDKSAREVSAFYTRLNGWSSTTTQKMSVGDKNRKNAATSPAKIICSVKKAEQLGGNLLCSIRGIKAGCEIVPRGRPTLRSSQPERQSASSTTSSSAFDIFGMCWFCNGCIFFRSTQCFCLCWYVVGLN